MVTKEKDDELALFLELRGRQKEREKHKLLLLHDSSGASDGPPGSPASKIVSSVPPRRTAAERLLDSEKEKSDHDWLITPPGTPLFPSLEIEPLASKLGMSNACSTALKSRLFDVQEEPMSKTNIASKHITAPSGLNPSSNGNSGPSSSGGPTYAARPAAPTGRATLSLTSKPLRSLTPTSRATLPPAKNAIPQVRSSTPTRTIARSSTPTARSSASAYKSTSRSATPSRLLSATASTPSATAPAGQSSSVTKSVPTTLKSPGQQRCNSPTVKSRPWKPNGIDGLSLDAPPPLRTSSKERPASATRNRPASVSRSRPGVSSTQSSSIEVRSNTKQRQQSSLPAKEKVSNGIQHGTLIPLIAKSRTRTSGSDDVSPVAIGSKMVERVVNTRKLAPPKMDDHQSTNNYSARKSPSLDSSGFGRTISKTSMDMALRHMDIRGTVSGNLRPSMTKVPASSMYGVRSGGSTRSRTVSISDSRLAASSNVGSEPSVNKSYFSDGRKL